MNEDKLGSTSTAMALAQRQRGTKPDLYKARGRIELLKKEIEKSEWYDQSAKKRTLEAISTTLQHFSRVTKSA